MSTPRPAFVLSDNHWNHYSVLKSCQRPFSDVAEMDASMITAWNEVVPTNGDVWYLGDFAWKKPQDILPQLNGRIHLIRGNHDHRIAPKKLAGFASIQDAKLIEVSYNDTKVKIYLHHYGCRVWPQSHYGTYHFYGHSHGNLPPLPRTQDVGVDVIGFAPKLITEVLAEIDHRDLSNPMPQGSPVERLIAWKTMSDAHIRLLMGEMSDQSIRDIKAVLRNIYP
jgi:calcineurin-like phosphoesterase family protein